MRVYVAGPVTVEIGDSVLRERDLTGQARLVLAMLAVEHRRAVSRDELADELWPDRLPRSWDTALRAVISKLRSALVGIGAPPDLIANAFGCYRIRLAPDDWLDLEAARDALHAAQIELTRGDARAALGDARVACLISSRPLLPGVHSPWVTGRRDRLEVLRVEAHECLAEALAAVGDFPQSARVAERAIGLDPYREPLHRRLIRSHALAGDRAGAARAFARCRDLLAGEFGIEPTPATVAVYREALELS